MAIPVLRHRILRNYKAAGKGVTTEAIISTLLKHVKESDYTGKGPVKAAVPVHGASGDAPHGSASAGTERRTHLPACLYSPAPPWVGWARGRRHVTR